jgi:hypothetical protein
MAESDNQSFNGLHVIKDIATDLLTGATLPAPVRRNLFKACGRLVAAAVEIPAAYLEGIADEKRAETGARVKLIETTSAQISDQMQVDAAYARAAVRKFGNRVLREQINLDAITDQAASVVKAAVDSGAQSNGAEISDDWLNHFEKEACLKSAADVQRAFAKILAGEIMNPSTFSLRTLRTLSQLDQSTAAYFKTVCSLAISFKVPETSTVSQSRVPTLGGQAGANFLKKYGLPYTPLTILQEHGLVTSELESRGQYGACIIQENSLPVPLWYRNQYHAFVPLAGPIDRDSFMIQGVTLTQTGSQLLSTVDELDSIPEFDADFRTFLKTLNVTILPATISITESGFKTRVSL